VPPKTLEAFRDHGSVEETLTRDLDQARQVLAEAERLGLDLDAVTDRLVGEGVASFAKAFDELFASMSRKHIAPV
jgi:transaldolase